MSSDRRAHSRCHHHPAIHFANLSFSVAVVIDHAHKAAYSSVFRLRIRQRSRRRSRRGIIVLIVITLCCHTGGMIIGRIEESNILVIIISPATVTATTILAGAARESCPVVCRTRGVSTTDGALAMPPLVICESKLCCTKNQRKDARNTTDLKICFCHAV